MNVARTDSHGGWIARPTDLVQFLMRADGFPAPPDILEPQTSRTMTAASARNADTKFGLAWEGEE
jgi:hypothetical protein